jgi:streptogramin lyase
MGSLRIDLGAAGLTLAAACSSSSPAPPPATHCDAVVALSDYASSGVGGLSLDGTGRVVFGVDLGKDPALAASGGRAFFVDRLGGKILELDPDCGGPTGRVFDADDPGHSGTSNPQDVAVAPDGALWVPRYAVPSVLVLPGSGTARSIDLTALDPDGNPNASAITIATAGGAAKAFVTLQRLDDTQALPRPRPGVPSQVLRLDVATAAIEGAVDLVGQNPFAVHVADDGAMWIAEPGDFTAVGETAAGVERFDPATSTTRLVAREADLGGSVSEAVVSPGGECGAAIVADASSANSTALVTFDPATGAALTTFAAPLLGPTGNFDLEGMVWLKSADTLLVGDRRSTARGYAVHAFHRTSGCSLEALPDAIFVQQKPIALRRSTHSG